MDELPLYTVDAFTKSPFSGNAAAICLVGARNLQESMMQQIAAEMNISETAYVKVLTPGLTYTNAEKFGLRWFTPTNEVSLCGHATLASAAVLFHQCGNQHQRITFSTLSGDLHAKRDKDTITLDFPNNPPETVRREEWDKLLEVVLGTYRDKVKNIALSPTVKKLVVQMEDDFTESDLMTISPDFTEMKKVHDGSKAKGIIVTVKGDGSYDFFSRYFAPWNGINEDPVTGSAHTVLAPYWANILKKTQMNARQCSKRGGDVTVTLREDDRVDITGHATIIVKGKINIPT